MLVFIHYPTAFTVLSHPVHGLSPDASPSAASQYQRLLLARPCCASSGPLLHFRRCTVSGVLWLVSSLCMPGVVLLSFLWENRLVNLLLLSLLSRKSVLVALAWHGSTAGVCTFSSTETQAHARHLLDECVGNIRCISTLPSDMPRPLPGPPLWHASPLPFAVCWSNTRQRWQLQRGTSLPPSRDIRCLPLASHCSVAETSCRRTGRYYSSSGDMGVLAFFLS